MSRATLPVVVLGGSGYVAGELLRLLAGHPVFRVAAVVSETRKDLSVQDNFFHLRGTSVEGLAFVGGQALDEMLGSHPSLGVFSALPHGEAAGRIDALLTAAERAGCRLTVVDLSADFRHADPARYEAIYGRPHPAPARLPEFACALPELTPALPPGARHVSHPGCFTTAATLALAPLLAGGWIEPRATVIAVTGSTGAGRTPTATTHHPERRSDLFAYAASGHRHEPEMRALLAAARAAAGSAGASAAVAPASAPAPAPAPAAEPEPEPEITFVPHSGPFARGIHATITARLARPATEEELRAAMQSFYDGSRPSSPESARSPSSPSTESFSSLSLPLPLSLPETEKSLSFVRIGAAPPRLQTVVGTNRCELALALRGETLVVFAALDNLVKGAAGGAVQWLNRLSGLPEAAGLALPGLGWL